MGSYVRFRKQGGSLKNLFQDVGEGFLNISNKGDRYERTPTIIRQLYCIYISTYFRSSSVNQLSF